MRAEQRSAVLSMKTELERMEAKQEEFQARKGTLAAQIQQHRAGGGAEGLGSRGGQSAFSEFRRMEEQVEGQVAQVAASREVEEAISGGGLSAAELEAKFAQLEHGRGSAGAADADRPGGSAVDDELAALRSHCCLEERKTKGSVGGRLAAERRFIDLGREHFERQPEPLEQLLSVARCGRQHESPGLFHHFVLTGLLPR